MTSFMPFRRWSGSVRMVLVLPILSTKFQGFAAGGPNGQGLTAVREQPLRTWENRIAHRAGESLVRPRAGRGYRKRQAYGKWEPGGSRKVSVGHRALDKCSTKTVDRRALAVKRCRS